MIGDVCTAEWLHEKLQVTSSSTSGRADVANTSGGGVLVLDCRTVDEYSACHVTGSLPVTVPPIMLRRLRNGNAAVSSVIGGGDVLRTSFIERWKSDWIVLYDNVEGGSNPTEHGSTGQQSLLSTLMTRLKSDGCRVCYLQGGFSSFRDKYNHMCIGAVHQNYQHCHNPHLHLSDELSNMRLSSSAPSSLSSLNLFIASEAESCNGRTAATPTPGVLRSGGLPFPVEVVPYLYLGDAETSRDRECLRQHDIRYIVNVTENVPNSFEDDSSLTYMRIPITDHWSQSLTSFFTNSIMFIDEARQAESSVLVHCLAGVSRSVTVTVAYLMYFLSLPLDDAFDYLRRIRPNIAPNFSFMGQLLDFEKTLQRARAGCCCPNVSRTPCQRCFCDITNSGNMLTSLSSSSSALSNSSVTKPTVIITFP